jgi:hypothetical protein
MTYEAFGLFDGVRLARRSPPGTRSYRREVGFWDRDKGRLNGCGR